MTTWTPVLTDTFNRANTTAGAAGSTTDVGNGWIDTPGGKYSIQSDALLVTTGNGTGYINDTLLRPSGEAQTIQRIVMQCTYVPGAPFVGVCLRANTVGRYFAALTFDAGSLEVYSYDAGVNQIGVQGGITFISGHVYQVDFSVTGTSPTAFTAILTDVTASQALAYVTGTDSLAALQTAGVPGIIAWGNYSGTSGSISVSSVVTYTGSSGGTSSASITATPASVIGGNTGYSGQSNVSIAITGIGTSFSGQPFALSGGYGAILVSQSVTDSTHGTVIINAGLLGQGNLTVTDTGTGASATITMATPALGTLNIGILGDSISYGTNGSVSTPMQQFFAQCGYSCSVTDQAVSGTGTSYWVPSAGNLAGAIAAFTAAAVNIVSLMLGTNDARTPNSLTPAQHFANMSAIVGALVAAGFKVVIHMPLYTVPNSGSPGAQWPQDPNTLYLQYFEQAMTLVDGITVFQGDTANWVTTAQNISGLLASDGIHPANQTANNGVAQRWAVAIIRRFGNSVGGPTTLTLFHEGLY